ncbi:hypothetical protein EDD11_004600 [Mortierella claussenii]|nr:hypothetical protein EDD11_004600 [Mortierella claussenii]
MAAVPTLPFVLLKVHKPSSTSEILAADAAAAAAAASSSSTPATTGAPRSSTSYLSHSPRPKTHPADVEAAPLSPASGGGTGALLSLDTSRTTSGVSQTFPPLGATSATTAPVAPQLPSSSIQSRTIHPQVHYIFENDPLESEILESIPKSRCITLDLDPKTGTIKNVESFLTSLQVMDVKLEPFQITPGDGSSGGGGGGGVSNKPTATVMSSFSSASTHSLGRNAVGGSNNSLNNTSRIAVQAMDAGRVVDNSSVPALVALRRTHSSGASSVQSSMTISATRMARQPSDKSLVNHASGTAAAAAAAAAATADNDSNHTDGTNSVGAKDWTLVIEAVEADDKDFESDSELLEQSMISSLDTDMMPDDYLSHCDALLKSFSARNHLVSKVIDYTSANAFTGGSSL